MTVFAAASVILLVLAAGDALSWPAFALGFAALAAIAAVYLDAARRIDRFAARGAAQAQARQSDAAAAPLESGVLEAMPDPVLVIGPAGRIGYLNAAAHEAYPNAHRNTLFSSIMRAPEVVDAAAGAITRGESATVEFRSPGANDRFFSAFVSPFEREGSDVRGGLVVVRDDSDVKRAALARADFLANASHELRTPLASLTGYIDTLRGHARDDSAARGRFLDIMSAQAERMRRLIDDLLSLSRIEQSEHLAPQGAADLAGLVGDVADALGPVSAAKEVSVEVVRHVGRAVVTGDRDELTQVLQNLVENAIKYSAAGGVVRVEVGEAADAVEHAFADTPVGENAGRLWILEPTERRAAGFMWARVSDEGVGIARRHLPRLSERFFRTEEDKDAQVDGTGLGLAIVKHIVSRHRGALTVESALGAGTRFTVVLPAAPRRREGAEASSSTGAT